MKVLLRYSLLSITFLFLSSYMTFSQYCSASASCDEMIAGVEISTFSNFSDCGSNGYTDYTNYTITLSSGSNYDFTVYNDYAYSSDMVYVWCDWNQDGDFYDSGEEYKSTTSDYSIFTGTVNVPKDAKQGLTRMRVRISYSSTPVPCGAMSYGETEDYTIDVQPPPPDALITDVTSPNSPFAVGFYPVRAILKSNNDITLTSAKITWYVNNVLQNSFNWLGSLTNGKTEELYLGNYSFTYPEGAAFVPFDVKVVVSNANGFSTDGNPTNDVYIKSLAPTLNDCGAIGFFGPPEGFGPGVTQVRARIRNYAPKPLGSVTVRWKIDGVEQQQITLTGLNIPNGSYQDLVVGTYTFYNKTPLSPFSVEVWTEKPNGVTDEDQTNDKYMGGIGPSLVSGIYTVGGNNSHFNDLQTAISYLNSSGVFGSGPVTFEVRPGTYTGQIILNNPPANGNPIIIRSSTGRSSDVTIRATASYNDNYVILVDGFNNLELQNITVQNPNPNYSLAGTVLAISNSQGVILNKVVLNGVQNSPQDNNYVVARLYNSCADLTGSTITGGSIGVYVDDGGYGGGGSGEEAAIKLLNNNSDLSKNKSNDRLLASCGINFDKNSFSNFSWVGIQVNDPYLMSSINVNGNDFKWESGTIPNYGVWVNGKANIISNTFNGIAGTGDVSEAVIKLESFFGSMDLNFVESNIINATNINGILVDNTAIYANDNYINISQTYPNKNALIYTNMGNGWIGNNMLVGQNINGINIENTSDFNVLYNTLSLNVTGNAFHTVDANFSIMRNLILNWGVGYNYDISGKVGKLFDNVHYINGEEIAIINAIGYSDVSSLANAGIETNSFQSNVTTKSASDLHIELYTPELLFGVPVFTGLNTWGNMIENHDYDGETRTSYYAGADEIFLRILLNRQSDGFIDCEGGLNNKLTVSGEINYGALMTYQWEKDGLPIQGQTEPVLYFGALKFLNSGVYRCKIMGPGTTATVYSKPVAVYVATPTTITREPENQSVNLGGLATLKFDAHVNGKRIEDAIVDYDVTVQWYKVINETDATPLTDQMARISGSKSNYLTINKFSSANFGKYFAEVIGLCGTIRTATVEIKEQVLDVTIIEAPVSASECAGTDVMFNADATTQSSLTITYQWFKDGVALNDVNLKIGGSNSKHLIVYDVQAADAGDYYAIARLQGTAVEATTSIAKLKVKELPNILVNVSDVTVKTGDQLSLEVQIENMEDPANKYQWYKDGVEINGETDFIYLKDNAQPEDAGNYWCTITNDCGTVNSANALVTITTSGTTDVYENTRNGYSLSGAIPNPVNSSSSIKFNMATAGNVQITLTDLNGSAIAELINGFAENGEHTLNINASKLGLVSGTYFIKFVSNGTILVNSIVVVR